MVMDESFGPRPFLLSKFFIYLFTVVSFAGEKKTNRNWPAAPPLRKTKESVCIDTTWNRI